MKKLKQKVIRALYSIIQIFGSKIYRGRIKKIESLDPVSSDFYVFNKLKKEILVAIAKIPFYQEDSRYAKAAQSKSIEEFLSNLPVISKSNLNSSEKSFFSPKWGRFRTKHTTSGSSGGSLTIYSSAQERLYVEAMLNIQVEKVVGSWGLRDCKVLSGFFVSDNLNPENFYIHDPVNNNIYVSIYHLKDENIEKYIQLIKMRKPKIIYGYASSIHEVARHLIARAFKPESVKMIISTSEILYEDQRSLIEKGFCSKVHNLYGSQEGGHFAFECTEGMMHVNPARGLVEVLSEDGISREGAGELLVTPINRNSFPLYRYNLGDLVKLSLPKNKCRCGLHTYIFTSIDGRSEDLVKMRDGRRIGYLNFHSTKNIPGILESQLIQSGWNEFKFIYVLDSKFHINKNEIENLVRIEIERRIGESILINFSMIDRVPRGARGKFKAVIVEKFQ